MLVAVSFILGLVIGSFLNVVIHRVPRRESLLSPPSHCPNCGMQIRWYHNVPLVAWAALRGRCSSCGAPISWRYPAVELTTGILFALAAASAGPEPRLVLIDAALAILVAVSFIDAEHLIIPNRIVLPAAAVGLVAAIALDPARWLEYLAAAVGAAGLLLVMALIWAGGMGLGDVKLALFLGAILGRYVAVGLFVAFLLGGLVGAALLVTGIKSRRDKIPFGPYLAAGGAIALLWGQPVLEFYLTFYD